MISSFPDDPCITLDALNTTLGSLYQVAPQGWNDLSKDSDRLDLINKRTQCFQDEVTIEPGEVIAVLAAATLLALEGLISQVMDFTRK